MATATALLASFPRLAALNRQFNIGACEKLRTAEDRRGATVLQFATNSNGDVTAVCVDPATTSKSSSVIDCLACAIAGWKFSDPEWVDRTNVVRFAPPPDDALSVTFSHLGND